MPFEELVTERKDNMAPTALISYMRGTHKDAKNGTPKPGVRPKLVITVPTTICGTAKAKTFKLLLGNGDDAGKLRIMGVPDDSGVKPAEMRSSFRFNFGYLPRLGDDVFDGGRRPIIKISDEDFEITVPSSWFENVTMDVGTAPPAPRKK